MPSGSWLNSRWHRLYVIPVAAEFICTGLFQLLGGSATQYVPFANGMALSTLVYASANFGGGHLNPYVSVSLLLTGHFTPFLTLMFVGAQISGGIAGAALQLALVPDKNAAGLGCFTAMHGTNRGAILGWESFLTYVLLITVHNVCLWRQSFAAMGPLVIGMALTACALTGGYWTGGSLNLARLLAVSAVKRCSWRATGFYVMGQVAGTLAAVLTSLAVNGFGTAWKLRQKGGEPLVPAPSKLLRGSMVPSVVTSRDVDSNESRLA